MDEDDRFLEMLARNAAEVEETKAQKRTKLENQKEKQSINEGKVPKQQHHLSKEQEDFDRIVKMFSHDMQQAIRQRHFASQSRAKSSNSKFKNGQTARRGRKIPREIQLKIGQATNLYAFQRFDEAIPLFEEVIKAMPELADITHTMSLIYREKGDLKKAFMFALLSAVETRTDHEKWLECAELSQKLDNFGEAIYCLNRAAKSLSEETEYLQILDIKLQKVDLYMSKRDFTSIVRMLAKQIKRFTNLRSKAGFS